MHNWSHGYHSQSFSSSSPHCRRYSFLFFLPDPVFLPVCPACHNCIAQYFPSATPVKTDFRSHHRYKRFSAPVDFLHFSVCPWCHIHKICSGLTDPSHGSDCRRYRKYKTSSAPVVPSVLWFFPAYHRHTCILLHLEGFSMSPVHAGYFYKRLHFPADRFLYSVIRSRHIHRHMFRHSEGSLPLSGSCCHRQFPLHFLLHQYNGSDCPLHRKHNFLLRPLRLLFL